LAPEVTRAPEVRPVPDAQPVLLRAKLDAEPTRAAAAPVPSAPAASDVPPPAPTRSAKVRTVPPPPPARRRRWLGIPMAAALLLAIGGALYFSQRQLELADIPLDESSTVPAPAVAAAPPLEAAEPLAPVAAALPAATGPVSPAEATAVVEEFRAAYEARNIDRILALFAADAAENGRQGRDAIAAGYRASLPALGELRYRLPGLAVESQGEHAQVRSPFVLTYRQADGGAVELHGEAEWALERRDGHAQIVTLNYRLDPEAR
jgi:ketosteroid isomerase-like protein